MSLRRVRLGVVAISVAGIAGMIVGSIKDNNGIAITFGLITAVAVLFLILLTTVVTTEAAASRAPGGPGTDDERLAEDIERRIQALVDAGSDELEVRRLVTRAVELGRQSR